MRSQYSFDCKLSTELRMHDRDVDRSGVHLGDHSYDPELFTYSYALSQLKVNHFAFLTTQIAILTSTLRQLFMVRRLFLHREKIPSMLCHL